MKVKYIFILSIIFMFLIISCSKEAINKEYEYIEINSEKSLRLPKNWSKKTGIYGQYYTDFESLIIINDDFDNDWEYTLLQSINFYRPDLISLNDKILNKDENSNQIILEGKKDIFIFSRILILKDKNYMITVLSNSKEKSHEIFEEIFKQ